MKSLALALIIPVAACGRPTEPGAVPQDRFAILAPASASADFSSMFSPAAHGQWSTARSRLRAFQFYQQSLRPSCATCGPNSVSTLLNALPGGAFRFLKDQGIQIGVEAGAVKEHTCDGRQMARVFLDDVAPIYVSGASVTYVAMDSPFLAALPVRAPSPIGRCDFSINEAVVHVAAFIRTVREALPGLRVGLIEPYPYFTMDEIMTFVRALGDNEGVGLSFFRLDYDMRHRFNVDSNTPADLKRLTAFLADRRIDFEVIVTGYDGRTDAPAVASALALAYEVNGAVGRPSAVAFQDFSGDGGISSVNLPEQQTGALTWLVNNGVSVFR